MNTCTLSSEEAASLAWISLGGNIKGPLDRFHRVIEQLSEIAASEPVTSPIYSTEPWGGIAQPAFLNQVVGFIPKRSPESTLTWLNHLEAKEGRHRPSEERWGPRTIDLDVLAWPRYTAQSEVLTVPHPRLSLRKFVLKPWADVAPDLIPFGLSLSIMELLRQCPDSSTVSPFLDASR